MNASTLVQAVRKAGVVGEGGAGFPAHVKYDTQAGTLIANGCECEPLLYTDQHLIQTCPSELVEAVAALRTAVGATRAVVALKSKYASAIAAIKDHAKAAGVELALLDNFYPAGDEQILVHEVTGRSIPPLGLPKDVDALVANVGTLVRVSKAMKDEPVFRKVLTVTGDVANPGIIDVPIGTSLGRCLDLCGGATVADPVFIKGGPMMGTFVENRQDLDHAVVTKTTGGLIVLPRGHYLHDAGTLTPETMQKRAATACIQCRYCTDLCPRYLVGQNFETHRVMKAFGAGIGAAEGALQAMLCCECGVCELFSCPMGLSPRRINAMFKSKFREQGLRYDGPREIRPDQSALRPYRKVPTSRLALKIGIAGYMDIHPEYLGEFGADEVRIPLSQHIGAPAMAMVKPGDTVSPGDLIGEIPEKALGARVHASIAGQVIRVDSAVVIKGAAR
jgi:Na+-translocating ferredoxin:NAD+ oxidoreductase RnfC subunit